MTRSRGSTDTILLVTIGALALFAIAIGLGRLFGADAGSYADWLAALATLAAFGAAVVAARYAAGAFQLETQREARWVENQERAQASLVAAWAVRKRSPAGTKRGVRVRNASDLPVNDSEVTVFVTITRPDYPEPVDHTPLTRHIGLVPPSDETRYYSITELDDRLSGIHEQHKVDVEIEFTFVDATGIRWRRDRRGQLSEVQERC